MVDNDTIIDKKRKELIEIIERYIDDNCVEFKKEQMKLLFKTNISNLIAKIAQKYRINDETRNEEGLIYNNSNNFSNDTQNQSNEHKFINKSNPSN